MNALANAKVGDYLNRHFVASFQKVGSFRVVNGQKQGGNVAAYFVLVKKMGTGTGRPSESPSF